MNEAILKFGCSFRKLFKNLNEIKINNIFDLLYFLFVLATNILISLVFFFIFLYLYVFILQWFLKIYIYIIFLDN